MVNVVAMYMCVVTWCPCALESCPCFRSIEYYAFFLLGWKSNCLLSEGERGGLGKYSSLMEAWLLH